MKGSKFDFRAKLREYEVTQIQNYDNPMFTGQHTPAERYGSVDTPWNTLTQVISNFWGHFNLLIAYPPKNLISCEDSPNQIGENLKIRAYDKYKFISYLYVQT